MYEILKAMEEQSCPAPSMSDEDSYENGDGDGNIPAPKRARREASSY